MTTPLRYPHHIPAPIDDDGMCQDCGHAICICPERCGWCRDPFQSKAEADYGMCLPCQIDAAVYGRNDAD